MATSRPPNSSRSSDRRPPCTWSCRTPPSRTSPSPAPVSTTRRRKLAPRRSCPGSRSPWTPTSRRTSRDERLAGRIHSHSITGTVLLHYSGTWTAERLPALPGQSSVTAISFTSTSALRATVVACGPKAPQARCSCHRARPGRMWRLARPDRTSRISPLSGQAPFS